MSSEEIYSELGPLTDEESKNLILELMNFFSPINNTMYREELGLKKIEGKITPLSLGNFLSYMNDKRQMDYFKYMNNIIKLIHKMESENLLLYTGRLYEGSPPLCNTYYSLCELTNLQQKTPYFWLGKIVGMSYIRNVFQKYIIRIEGEYKDKNIAATGSGILINNNTILTCAHNINDIKEHKCFLNEKKLKIVKLKPHDKYDIGIIKIEQIEEIEEFPYFGEPRILDKTLTLGYPPLRGMREAALISQSGEINAIAKDLYNIENITISSITRPGNSGGPVISEEGYIVGIVVNSTNESFSISSNKENIDECKSIPFYNAISSNEIIKILKDIEPKIEIIYEDYK